MEAKETTNEAQGITAATNHQGDTGNHKRCADPRSIRHNLYGTRLSLPGRARVRADDGPRHNQTSTTTTGRTRARRGRRRPLRRRNELITSGDKNEDQDITAQENHQRRSRTIPRNIALWDRSDDRRQGRGRNTEGLRRGLNEDSATDTEIEFTKEELMRSLSSASAELSNLAELTGNQAYSDAGTQIASIMELVDNL